MVSQYDPAQLHPYLALFNRHLHQFQRHLTGVSKSYVSSPSIIGGILWTAAEKDAFFHALSVYSRFRPDLIAACVETKNEVEVLEYLALLEEGSLRPINSEEYCREKLPSAREVSESWISWEEANAERLRLNEEVWTGIERNVSRGRALEQNAESAVHPETLPSDTEHFGGLRNLAYAHLHVLGKMLRGTGDQQSDTGRATASPIIDANTASAQLATEVGSISPTRRFQQSTSGTLDDSLNPPEKSPLSRSDLDPSREDSSTYLQNLTPRSRRRHQKRIHMRRKRAQLKGERADMAMDRLKTGPRKKTGDNTPEIVVQAATSGRKTRTEMAADPTVLPIPGDYADQIETVDSGEDTDNDPSSDKKTRGQYKTAWSDFSRHNVSQEAIIADDLDVFNYPRLGRLLRHFISGYDSSLISQDASVNAETLILLLEILKDFLIQVISRVITLEEEHRRLRGTTKVWRKNTDEKEIIDSSAIQFALKTMGILKETIHQYFANLLGEKCDPPTYHQTGYDDDERLVRTQNIFHQHPLHQGICLPHYLGVQQTRPGDNTDNWMETDVDDEMLIDELEQEELLDKDDKLADQRHEEALWREVPLPRKKAR